MSLRIKKIRKKSPNPFEELLYEVTAGIHNLFPPTKELAHELTFKPPPSNIEADYAFSAFSIASLVRQDPVKIATRIAEYFSENPLKIIKKVYAIGPYINIEVDKQSYREKALNHILDQGKQFGTYHGKNSSTVFINYFSSDFTSRLTLDSLRTLLVGKAIGECYKKSSNTVKHNYYVTDWYAEKRRKIILKNMQKTHREIGIRISSYTTESEFVSLGREVVDDALKQSLARHAANTQAVITSPFDSAPPLVLQKNDGSVTSFVRHLAYIKCCLSETRLSTFICISAEGQAHVIEALLTNARRLKYLPMGIKTSTIFISQTDKKFPMKIDRPLQYTVLRTPINKEIEFEPEDHTCYSRIVNFIDQLKTHTEKPDLINEFSIIKLLISFPVIIADVQSSHEPSHVCAYLEEVLQQCEKLSVGQDELLSKAVAVVLKNGLNLLTS